MKYVITINNGESHEDEDYWTAVVSDNEESAKKAVIMIEDWINKAITIRSDELKNFVKLKWSNTPEYGNYIKSREKLHIDMFTKTGKPPFWGRAIFSIPDPDFNGNDLANYTVEYCEVEEFNG